MVELNQFKAARDKAMSELRVSIARRRNLDVELAKLNVRIEELRKGIEGLNALCGDDGSADPDLLIEISNLNLADAVRAVLASSELHLTPMDIRYKLKRLGYKVEDYTNALASIHTIIKRLEDSGLADTINKEGKTAYRLLKSAGNYTSPGYSES